MVAVGGTELARDAYVRARLGAKTVWSSTGSGCSAFEPIAAVAARRSQLRRLVHGPSGRTPTFPSRIYGDVAYAADNVAAGTIRPRPRRAGASSPGRASASPAIAAIYGLSGYGGRDADDETAFPARKLYASRRSLFDVT